MPHPHAAQAPNPPRSPTLQRSHPTSTRSSSPFIGPRRSGTRLSSRRAPSRRTGCVASHRAVAYPNRARQADSDGKRRQYAIHSHPKIHDDVLSPQQIEDAIVVLSPRENEDTLRTEDIVATINQHGAEVRTAYLRALATYPDSQPCRRSPSSGSRACNTTPANSLTFRRSFKPHTPLAPTAASTSRTQSAMSRSGSASGASTLPRGARTSGCGQGGAGCARTDVPDVHTGTSMPVPARWAGTISRTDWTTVGGGTYEPLTHPGPLLIALPLYVYLAG